MNATSPAPHPDDFIVWPDGTCCERRELEEYLTFMTDDFQVLYCDTPAWVERCNAYNAAAPERSA